MFFKELAATTYSIELNIMFLKNMQALYFSHALATNANFDAHLRVKLKHARITQHHVQGGTFSNIHL